jgi:chromate transporter
LEVKQIAQEVAGSVEFLSGDTSVPSMPLWRLGWLWFVVGLQSFGGGTATLFLIRRMAVDQYKWLTPDEFTRDWSLVQASPGINLLCMVILVGQRVAGFGGALAALGGLMLPSVVITIVMTALYATFRDLPVVQAALRGVVPATVGLGLVLTYRMVRPLLAAGRREGVFALVVHVAILIGASTVMLLWQVPVVAILCGAGVINGTRKWLRQALGQAGTKVAHP